MSVAVRGNVFKTAQLDVGSARSACEAIDATRQEASPATAEDLIMLANLQRLDKAIALLCQRYAAGQGDQPKEMEHASRKSFKRRHRRRVMVNLFQHNKVIFSSTVVCEQCFVSRF